MPRTLIDEGELREVYHYRPVATAREQGDPVLLVTPLAAPALCFDLRRGCSLVEHFVEAGRPTYLVEYGEVSFKNRALGIEHWVDEVVPTAVEEVSKHAGGRPVHLVGWSLGGIFSLLAAADRRDLPIASVTVVGSPVDVTPGAAGRPAAAAPELHRRPAADAGLPVAGRRPEAAGEVGLPALVVPEADHQAARRRGPSRRCRLPRPDRGGGPVHRQHDRLPGPSLRPALPPVRAQQRAERPAGSSSATAPSTWRRSPHRSWSSPAPRTASHRWARSRPSYPCSAARPRCASRSSRAATSGC